MIRLKQLLAEQDMPIDAWAEFTTAVLNMNVKNKDLQPKLGEWGDDKQSLNWGTNTSPVTMSIQKGETELYVFKPKTATNAYSTVGYLKWWKNQGYTVNIQTNSIIVDYTNKEQRNQLVSDIKSFLNHPMFQPGYYK
jgi:hypothetical protein